MSLPSRQPDPMQQLTHTRRIGPSPGESAGQDDVLPGGQRRHEVERLEDHPDSVAPEHRQLLFAHLRDVLPCDAYGARLRAVQTGGALQQGALARAGRAHHRGESAAPERDADQAQGDRFRAAPAVCLGHLLEDDSVIAMTSSLHRPGGVRGS
ncbi:hypothetical protein Mro03_23740 [Microbispora rosea subsp. rosea]|nr:hypothetical protein Mro03_23740 [Microbispora rosea subsp. rosea]